MRRSARCGSSTHSISGSHVWAISSGKAASSACLSRSAAPANSPCKNSTFSCDIAYRVSPVRAAGREHPVTSGFFSRTLRWSRIRGLRSDVVHPRAGLLGLAAGDVGDRRRAEDLAQRLDSLGPDAAGLLALLAQAAVE